MTLTMDFMLKNVCEGCIFEIWLALAFAPIATPDEVRMTSKGDRRFFLRMDRERRMNELSGGQTEAKLF